MDSDTEVLKNTTVKLERLDDKVNGQDTKIAVLVSLAENLKDTIADLVSEFKGLRNEIQNLYVTSKEHLTLVNEVKEIKDNAKWIWRTVGATIIGIIGAFIFK